MVERINGSSEIMKVPQFKPFERFAYSIISGRLGKSIGGLYDTHEDVGATDEFIRRYNLGDYGLVAMNHLCYADPLSIMKQVERVRKLTRANGFLLIASLTLVNGLQVEGNKWYKPLVGFFNNNSIYPVPVATANDLDRLSKQGYDDHEAKQITSRVNASATRRIRAARDHNLIVITMPEASLEGARLNKEGKLNGMQKIGTKALGKILGGIVEGKVGSANDFVTLPVGIWGSERLLDPTTYKVSREVRLELVKGFVPFVPQHTFANARIGEPFGKREYRHYLHTKGRLDESVSDSQLGEFMKEEPDAFFDFLMGEKIAPMVPQIYRGAYGSSISAAAA